MRGLLGALTFNVGIYYFNLHSTIITVFIDTDTTIKGVQIEDHEEKISNFADDTTILLTTLSISIH